MKSGRLLPDTASGISRCLFKLRNHDFGEPEFLHRFISPKFTLCELNNFVKYPWKHFTLKLLFLSTYILRYQPFFAFIFIRVYLLFSSNICCSKIYYNGKHINCYFMFHLFLRNCQKFDQKFIQFDFYEISPISPK